MQSLWSVSIVALFLASSYELFAQETDKKQEQLNPAIITTQPPSGFGDLLLPQTTLVQVYYSRNFVGDFLVTYTPDTIKFHTPEDLVSKLPDLSTPKHILDQILVPLPTNGNKACLYGGQQNCGFIEPEVVGVIFNESTFRVDLFVNPDLRRKQYVQPEKYLPPSTTDFSMLHGFILNASGQDGIEEVYSAQINSLLSYQNYRLRSNIDSISDSKTRVDQLSLEYEFQDLLFEGGAFRTTIPNNNFFNQRDFIGLRFQTSLNSRTDLEQISSNPLYVFLNERARVEIYQDDELLDTQFYAAGNQQLNTQRLPDGAYPIRIKIIESSGRISEETQFLSKSLRLPPPDQNLYFVELGNTEEDAVERFPKASNNSLLRMGVNSRITDNFGLSGSLVFTEQAHLLETGLFYLGEGYDIQTNLGLTSSGDWGTHVIGNLRLGKYIASISHRRTVSDFGSPGDTQQIELIDADSTQSSATFGMPFKDASLSLIARLNDSKSQPRIESYGVNWRLNLYRYGSSLIDLVVDASKQNDDRRILLGLQYRLIGTGQTFSYLGEYNKSRIASQDDTHFDQFANYSQQFNDLPIGDIINNYNASDVANSTTLGVRSEIKNQFADARFEVERIKTGGNDTQSHAIGLEFSMVSSEDEIAFGGKRPQKSGVIVELVGNDIDGVLFDVIIDDGERHSISGGGSRYIPLRPYNEYTVGLVATGDSLVAYDSSPRRVTLYPGNIEHLKWDINQIKVVVAQAIDKDGVAIPRALINGANGFAATDLEGWFQVEITDIKPIQLKTFDGKTCTINFPELDLSQQINVFERLRCQ